MFVKIEELICYSIVCMKAFLADTLFFQQVGGGPECVLSPIQSSFIHVTR